MERRSSNTNSIGALDNQTTAKMPPKGSRQNATNKSSIGVDAQHQEWVAELEMQAKLISSSSSSKDASGRNGRESFISNISTSSNSASFHRDREQIPSSSDDAQDRTQRFSTSSHSISSESSSIGHRSSQQEGRVLVPTNLYNERPQHANAGRNIPQTAERYLREILRIIPTLLTGGQIK